MAHYLLRTFQVGKKWASDWRSEEDLISTGFMTIGLFCASMANHHIDCWVDGSDSNNCGAFLEKHWDHKTATKLNNRCEGLSVILLSTNAPARLLWSGQVVILGDRSSSPVLPCQPRTSIYNWQELLDGALQMSAIMRLNCDSSCSDWPVHPASSSG